MALAWSRVEHSPLCAHLLSDAQPDQQPQAEDPTTVSFYRGCRGERQCLPGKYISYVCSITHTSYLTKSSIFYTVQSCDFCLSFPVLQPWGSFSPKPAQSLGLSLFSGRGGLHPSSCSELDSFHGSFLEPLSALEQAVGPVTWGCSGLDKRKPVALAWV